MTLFTIIIPVYNVEAFLRKCLDSVVNQTNGDWECICVDDGSPDNCGKILDEYKASFKGAQRFEVIHQPNGGVSAARNVALDMARGEWVQFLDADDSLALDFLERLSRDISQHSDVDAIEHAPIYCYQDGRRVVGTTSGRMPPEVVLDAEEILADPFGRKYTNLGRCSCYKIFHRSVIETANLRFTPGIPLGEDELFAAQFYAYAGKVAVCPKTAGYLRIFRGDSAIHQITVERLVPKLKAMEILYGTWLEHKSKGLSVKLSAVIVVTAFLGCHESSHVRADCIEALLNSRFYSRIAIPFLLLHGTTKARLFAFVYLFSPRFIRRRLLNRFNVMAKVSVEE